MNQDPSEYAANVLLSRTPIDGLFVALAVAWKKTHVAVAHSRGVWSLRLTRTLCLGGLLLLVTDTGLWREEAIFRYENVSFPTIAERVRWTTSPPIIRSVVQDAERLAYEMGYRPKVNTQPGDLLVVLSNFFYLSPDCYHKAIIDCMEANLADLEIAQEWWAAQGQDWNYYKTVLESGLRPDGLEVWVACIASGTYMNLIQKGQLWSSHTDGPVKSDITVMLVPDSAVFCDFASD